MSTWLSPANQIQANEERKVFLGLMNKVGSRTCNQYPRLQLKEGCKTKANMDRTSKVQLCEFDHLYPYSILLVRLLV